MSTSTRNWVAVASAEHVRVGRDAGFMQVCDGKAVPLRRIKPGDCVVYYSPTTTFRGTDKLQAFTAIGTVQIGEPYPFDMGNNFRPYRRNVAWAKAKEVSIRPLLGQLSFTANNKGWGYQLRFGLFEISAADMNIVFVAMNAPLVGKLRDDPGDRFTAAN